MRIIISPAKKMNVQNDIMGHRDLPVFLEQTDKIYETLRGMSYEELKKLWKCSDKIAEQNFGRLETMDLRSGLSLAVLAYEGIQYQYMAPAVFTESEHEYVQEHLRILSGFYGILKPFDGVVPYRLEMQAKLSVEGKKNLYDFWGKRLADELSKDSNCTINLASKEYSDAVSKHLDKDHRFITCIFGEIINGKIVEKGTLCKMARGEMVRRMAEHNVKVPEEIKKLPLTNYSYSEEFSDDSTYVFLVKKVK